jgi:asparagine synthase (glutamine-hydrolysing)
MMDTIAHRGPNGAGHWNNGCVGLGNRLLWTTPESLKEKLPVVNRAGRLVLTADARIDNRIEVMAALGLNKFSSQKITDSRLILKSYEKWGQRCPEYLLGDFAFAIWDGFRQQLFCARDHFGVKPFYYYSDEHLFVFASEIKAILALSSVPRRLNKLRIAEYLTSQFDDTAITLYKGILRIPPGNYLTVRREGTQLKPYWSLDPQNQLCLQSDKAYTERFRELLTEAVRSRLRSVFPVGSFLSGGLDSSSVTCTARMLLSQNGGKILDTFSAVFNQVPQCDERPYIDAVLAGGDFKPHYIRGDLIGPLSDIDHVFRHQDEAFYASNLFINWAIYKSAKDKGVRIMLDGFDGDTTVSHGTGYLRELATSGHWISLAQELRGIAKNIDRPYRALMWEYLWLFGLKSNADHTKVIPSLHRLYTAFLRRTRPSTLRRTNQRKLSPILNQDFARNIDFYESHNTFLSESKTENELHLSLLKWGVMPFTLEVLDRAAAAFSIEPRYPFWDKHLIEFCLSLPPAQKIYRGWTRMILRRAMHGILPPKIQWRRGKSNLAPNFRHTFLTFEQRHLHDTIIKDSFRIEPYVNIKTVQQAYQRYLSGNAIDEEVQAIWKSATLALWLRFIEN